MKNIFLLLIIPVVFAGCRKDLPPALFEMKYLNLSSQIPAGLNVFLSYYDEIENIPTNADLYLIDHQLTREEVTSIIPKTCRLIATDPGTSFDFIREISVKIYSTNDPELKFEIFYDDFVSENVGTVLNLIPNGNDMKEFLLDDHFSIEIGLRRLRDSPTRFTQVRMDLEFEVR